MMSISIDKNRTIVTLFALLASVVGLHAQTPTTPAAPLRLSLADAVTSAIGNATQPQLASLNEQRAQVAVAQARASLLPETEARLMRYNQSINLATFGFTLPGFPAVSGPFNVTDAQITAAMQLFNLAALKQYQASRAGATASRYQREQAEDEVAAAVARLYVLVQRAETEIATRQANVSLFEQLRKVANDQFVAGTGIHLDVNRADVQLAQERQGLLVARNQRETARIALLHVIGADESVAVVLTDTPPRPSAPPSAESQLAIAYQERADLKQLAEQHRAAILGVEAARDQRIPSVGIDFLGDMSGNHADDLRWSRRIGATLNVPIYAGGRIAAQLREAKIQEKEVEIQQNETRRQIEDDVRRSILSIESALARVDVASQTVRVAEEELTVARDRVANGVGSSIEIDRAQDAYRQAHEDEIMANADAAIANIDLLRATGTIRRTIAPGTIIPTSNPAGGSLSPAELQQLGVSAPVTPATPVVPTVSPVLPSPGVSPIPTTPGGSPINPGPTPAAPPPGSIPSTTSPTTTQPAVPPIPLAPAPGTTAPSTTTPATPPTGNGQ